MGEKVIFVFLALISCTNSSTDFVYDDMVQQTRIVDVQPLTDVVVYTDLATLFFLIPAPAPIIRPITIEDCSPMDLSKKTACELRKYILLAREVMANFSMSFAGLNSESDTMAQLKLPENYFWQFKDSDEEGESSVLDKQQTILSSKAITLRDVLTYFPDRNKRSIIVSIAKKVGSGIYKAAKQVVKGAKKLAKGVVKTVVKGSIVGKLTNKLISCDMSPALKKSEYSVRIAQAHDRFTRLQAQSVLSLGTLADTIREIRDIHMTNLRAQSGKNEVLIESLMELTEVLNELVNIEFAGSMHSIYELSTAQCVSNPALFMTQDAFVSEVNALEKRLPEHLKMAIGINDYQKALEMKMGDCKASAVGSLYSHMIPLARRDTDYRVISVKTSVAVISGWRCSINIEQGLLVLEVTSGRIFVPTQEYEKCIKRNACELNSYRLLGPQETACIRETLGNPNIHSSQCSKLLRCSYYQGTYFTLGDDSVVLSKIDHVFAQLPGKSFERIELDTSLNARVYLPCGATLKVNDNLLRPNEVECTSGDTIRVMYTTPSFSTNNQIAKIPKTDVRFSSKFAVDSFWYSFWEFAKGVASHLSILRVTMIVFLLFFRMLLTHIENCQLAKITEHLKVHFYCIRQACEDKNEDFTQLETTM